MIRKSASARAADIMKVWPGMSGAPPLVYVRWTLNRVSGARIVFGYYLLQSSSVFFVFFCVVQRESLYFIVFFVFSSNESLELSANRWNSWGVWSNDLLDDCGLGIIYKAIWALLFVFTQSWQNAYNYCSDECIIQCSEICEHVQRAVANQTII